MYRYGHGGNAVYENEEKSVLDLSANINPLGMPKGVMDAIETEATNCDRYPDSSARELRERIARFENIDPEWIFCGGGASDIIFRLPAAARAKKVMVTAPAFSDYERAATVFGAETVRYGLSAAGDFVLDSGFPGAIEAEKPDLVFVCNPNNPTGKLAEAGLIEEILERCRDAGAYLVCDECFLDFTEQAEKHTAKAFLEHYPNLVILKAFTKIFSLPGIRLGYAICRDGALIDRLYYHGTDWPVSNLAQAAGAAALEDAEAYIKKTVNYVSKERGVMEKELARLGYRVFGSAANFVFLRNPYPFDLGEDLDARGIRIRPCGNFHGLDGSYFRIAVSASENNVRVLSAISEITGAFAEGVG